MKSKKNVLNCAKNVQKVLYLQRLFVFRGYNLLFVQFLIIYTMAKGNMFLSQARGKVGSVVFAVVKGQQTARVHNPRPANPRTNGQQAQRSLLANMTKFYKRGTQNFFKFAYEDRTIRESDFNAFARKNIMRGVYMPKELYDHPGTPALGKYIVSDGSITTNIQDYFSGENYGIVVPGTTAITTVGALSAALIAQSPNLVEGDIFTMVLADSEFGAEMMTAGVAPTWQIFQFYLDTADLRPLAQIGMQDIALPEGATGRYIGVDIAGVDRASFGATIISRKTAGGLLVSTSEVKGSAVANVLYDWLRGEYMKRQAAISWGANPEAVLQGSLIGTLPEVTSIELGSSSTKLPAYAYGAGVYSITGASSSEIRLNGSNLRTTAQGAVYKVKFYNSDIITDGLVTQPVVEYTFTGAGSTSLITLTKPADTEAVGSQFYMLIEVDGVPVWYGLGIEG